MSCTSSLKISGSEYYRRLLSKCCMKWKSDRLDSKSSVADSNPITWSNRSDPDSRFALAQTSTKLYTESLLRSHTHLYSWESRQVVGRQSRGHWVAINSRKHRQSQLPQQFHFPLNMLILQRRPVLAIWSYASFLNFLIINHYSNQI